MNYQISDISIFSQPKISSRSEQANKLIFHLEKLYSDELLKICEKLRYNMQDLLLKSPAKSSRYSNLLSLQNEENRIKKIIHVATLIYSSATINAHTKPRSLRELLSLYGIHDLVYENSSLNSTFNLSSSIFHTPNDVIQYNIDRATAKFNKSVEIIKRIEEIKSEAERKKEVKLQKSKDREAKLLEDKDKRDDEHEKSIQKSNEQRSKILQNKKEIISKLNKQLLNFGAGLQSRMAKLSTANQSKLKELVGKQFSLMKQRIVDHNNRIVNYELQSKLQDQEVNQNIFELENKIERRISRYENNIKKKVDSAKENNLKVERTFSKSLTNYHKKTEEKLRKIINDSLVTEGKKQKKQIINRKYSSCMRESMNSSFMKNNKSIENLNEIESRRIQNIETRVAEKARVFRDLKSKFEEALKAKKQKNSARFEKHTEKYSRALESQMELRMKTLDKHIRITNAAEELKMQRYLISNNKRRDNFEVQRIRSLASSSLRKKCSPYRLDTM